MSSYKLTVTSVDCPPWYKLKKGDFFKSLAQKFIAGGTSTVNTFYMDHVRKQPKADDK